MLEAARSGDEDAFRLLVEPDRARLHAHCYRMLGSVDDAEDALQDALLRAWRGLGGFDGRSTFRRWLYRVTTNACLDALARRPTRVVTVDYELQEIGAPDDPVKKVPDSLQLEAYSSELGARNGHDAPAARYERREAVALAFAALQHLPPRQRAVLVLREVLGFSAKEVADLFGMSGASVNSALQRARKAVGERLAENGQQAAMRPLGGGRARKLVEQFVDAFERGDVEAIVALVDEDAARRVARQRRGLALVRPAAAPAAAMRAHVRPQASEPALHEPRARNSWGRHPQRDSRERSDPRRRGRRRHERVAGG